MHLRCQGNHFDLTFSDFLLLILFAMLSDLLFQNIQKLSLSSSKCDVENIFQISFQELKHYMSYISQKPEVAR